MIRSLGEIFLIDLFVIQARELNLSGPLLVNHVELLRKKGVTRIFYFEQNLNPSGARLIL